MSTQTAQDEARALCKDLIDGLFSGSVDLKSALRQAQHACNLLGWTDKEEWFRDQLRGYSSQEPAPEFRRASGKIEWRTDDAAYDPVTAVRRRMRTGSAEFAQEEEDSSVELVVFAPLEWLQEAAQNGFVESTSKRKQSYSAYARKNVERVAVNVYPAASFKRLLEIIERAVFDFASATYSVLAYGNTLSDIWSEHRGAVEERLTDVGSAGHLKAITDGLDSENPEDWRLAVNACRNLLEDIANYLWNDERPTYEYLPGDGPQGKLHVVKGKTKNRLAAYLHQKGMTGTTGNAIRDELEALVTSLASLYDEQSSAHQPVERGKARTLALSTYFLVGRVVLESDFQPITEYQALDR